MRILNSDEIFMSQADEIFTSHFYLINQSHAKLNGNLGLRILKEEQVEGI